MRADDIERLIDRSFAACLAKELWELLCSGETGRILFCHAVMQYPIVILSCQFHGDWTAKYGQLNLAHVTPKYQKKYKKKKKLKQTNSCAQYKFGPSPRSVKAVQSVIKFSNFTYIILTHFQNLEVAVLDKQKWNDVNVCLEIRSSEENCPCIKKQNRSTDKQLFQLINIVERAAHWHEHLHVQRESKKSPPPLRLSDFFYFLTKGL